MDHYKISPEQNPFSILVADLTHRCNMECANCYIPNRDIPDMDVEKFYDLLEKLPNRTYIRLIGAEPTVRNDLPEIIMNVRSRGHQVSLTTNGLRLHKQKYVDALKNAGLRLALISMNGAADDEVYKILDNGEFARYKIQALENCMRANMIINTGTIIARGVNEHIMKEQIDLFLKTAKRLNYNPRVKPVLRFKSVGDLGRSMGSDHTLHFNELIDLCKKDFDIKKSEIKGKNIANEEIYEYENILIRFVDWEVNDEGVVDADSDERGRITEDFMVAPFFEDIKKNEFGY